MEIHDTLAPAKYRYCSKHIVVMTWFDQDVRNSIEDPWRYLAVSGFVMSYADRWFLATAGHIVRDIEHNRINGLTRIRSMAIVDHGGVESAHMDAFPFDYEDAEKYFVVTDDSDGLDFGFIELKPFYRKMMEANSIVPIAETHWDRDDADDFEEYFVMGLPLNQQIRLGGISSGEVTLQGRAKIVVMPILRVADEHAPPQKSNRVIYAKVRDQSVKESEHVNGFSGSPVFGMGPRNDDGTIPYRIIGMQYAWMRHKRMIIASPLRTFARLFQKHLAAESERGDTPPHSIK